MLFPFLKERKNTVIFFQRVPKGFLMRDCCVFLYKIFYLSTIYDKIKGKIASFFLKIYTYLHTKFIKLLMKQQNLIYVKRVISAVFGDLQTHLLQNRHKSF